MEKRIPTDVIGSGNYHYYTERYTYDETGNVLSKVVTGTKEPLSKRITNYIYYSNGLIDTIIQNNGKLTKNSYDKNGNVIKVESMRDNDRYDVTRYEYDNQNRMIKTIQLVEAENIFEAEKLPNINNLRDSEYTDRIQIITGYEYDILGNKTKAVSPEAYRYLESDEGNRADYSTVYTYDLLNRPEKIIRRHNDEEVFTQYWYDEVGNKIKERNEKGYLTIQTYNNMNKVETLTDALGKTYRLCASLFRLCASLLTC